MTSVKVQIKCAVTLCHLNTCQQMDLFVIEHEDDSDTTDFHQSSDHGLSPLNSVLEAAKSGLAGHPDAAMDWNNERWLEVIGITRGGWKSSPKKRRRNKMLLHAQFTISFVILTHFH